MCVPASQRFAGKVGEAGEIFREVGRLIFSMEEERDIILIF